MSTPLRVLILEDNPSDAELMLHELAREGFEPDWLRVDREQDYLNALNPALEVILADYSLPQFDAMFALQLLKERGLDIPFIVVTASISEEVAVGCMKQGAADYLLKDRLGRLGPSVRRALADKRLCDEKQKAEAALRESEQRFRELADSLPETVFEVDTTGRLTFISRAAFEQHGYTRDDFDRSLNVLDMIASEDRKRAKHNFDEMLAARPAEPRDYTALKKDGSTFPAIVSSNPIMCEGKVVGLRGFVMDITERKRAEEKLRQSEERFRATFERAPIGIKLLDASGLIVDANLAVQRMLGYSREELMGRSCADITHPDDAPTSIELFEKLLSGERDHYQVEKRYYRKDSQPIWCRLTVSLLRMAGSEPPLAIGMMEDITRRKQLEEQLIQAQRLEMAGRVAAQVAHDFGNLMVPLVAYPELIKLQLPQGHPGVLLCDTMLEAVERMAELNEDMMCLGRRGHIERYPTDLNRIVDDAVRRLAGKADNLTIKLDLDPDLLPASGSEVQLLRAVTNLVFNACEAMRGSGVLHIKTENCYVDRPFGRHNQVETGEYVKLTIVDTGCGVPPESRAKIFDPFFTTKGNAKRPGCGLGLAIVQAIVEDHRGYIDLDSEVGRCTTFTVYLPISRGPVKETSREQLRGGTEAVLVVDDNQFQREAVSQMLKLLGYQVQTVASGEEAVARLREHPTDLLILDMVMPGGMDGAETYRDIVGLCPGQRAIIVSGFAESERVKEAQAMGAGAYLRKPLTLEKLARTVREELKRGRTEPTRSAGGDRLGQQNQTSSRE